MVKRKPWEEHLDKSLLRYRHPRAQPKWLIKHYRKLALESRDRKDRENYWWFVYEAAIWDDNRPAEREAYQQAMENNRLHYD